MEWEQRGRWPTDRFFARPSFNKTSAACGRLAAASEPTGRVADRVWGRMGRGSEGCAKNPLGWAGSALAER